MRTIALCLACCLAAPAAAADLKPASRVDAVTVYRSSARVTRTTRAEVPAGAGRVLLEGLPAELDDDSVRVEGKGGAKVRVHGVTVEAITRGELSSPEVRGAEARLESLAQEDQALDDRIAAARNRAKFAESLRSSYSEERAKNLAVRPVSAREWADLVGYVDATLEKAAADQRKAEAQKKELQRRLQAAQAELEKLNAKRNETTKTLAVEIDAERAGDLELAVSYAVPSASWQPVWDARLRPEAGTVELSLMGTVSQRTGEDWRDARLAVSTAEPGRGLWVPQLDPVWLQKLQPQRPPMPMAAKAAAPMQLQRQRAEDRAVASGAVEADAAQEEAVMPALAEAEMGLLAATFTAPRRESVDGSGRERTVSLSSWTLQASIQRVAAPRSDPAAYLTAVVQNDTGVPLLPGLARVSVDGELVGRAPVALTPPGGELKLAFGADGRVEVERKVLERRHETSGIVSKDDVIRYRIRTVVKNRYAVATKVQLLDLVPVSRDESIQVKVLDGTTPATREDPSRPGVRITVLELKPKETQTVELRYEVRFPRGMPVQGLE